MIKLSKLKPNPDNPRHIRDDKFKKLVQSLETFAEKMMPQRPIIVDEKWIILGGNQRFKALKELGYKDVPNDWIRQVLDWTEEDKREFIIKDNVSFGEFDWQDLEENWSADDLDEWGVDIPSFDTEDEKNYSDKNKEINTGEFSDKMTIKLDYTEEDYHRVKEAFLNIGGTPEKIIWQLLKLDDVAF